MDFPLWTSVHSLLWDLLTYRPEFCSSCGQDPPCRGRNTISKSLCTILSTASLALSFQANIAPAEHCFPTPPFPPEHVLPVFPPHL